MELGAIGPADLMAPVAEIEENEKLVGEANLELKKLFTLWRSWERTATEIALRGRYAKTEEEMREALSAASVLYKKSELIRDIFWASVREAFGLWDKDVVGIRQGWKIAWSESDDSLPPFFRQLFGGSL